MMAMYDPDLEGLQMAKYVLYETGRAALRNLNSVSSDFDETHFCSFVLFGAAVSFSQISSSCLHI